MERMSEIEILDVADILCNPGLLLKDLKRFFKRSKNVQYDGCAGHTVVVSS